MLKYNNFATSSPARCSHWRCCGHLRWKRQVAKLGFSLKHTKESYSTSSISVKAIGFELPGDPDKSNSVEKLSEELTKRASSLLLYQQALAGRPAQAFLLVLLHLQKGSSLKLLEHYGELYKSLAAEGRSSWQDYVLDQIVRGGDSPFAKSAAKGKPTQHLMKAVEHDLDVLQQLSVVDRTLATWVKETAYGVSPAWLAAASNLAPGSPPSSPDMAEAQPGTAATPPNWVGKPPQWLLPPLSAEQREMMKGEIAGQWRWSEAAGLLADYHAAHGYGLISMHGVLTWTGSTLAGQDVLKGMGSLNGPELALPPHSALLTALERMVGELHTPPQTLPHHWCIPDDPLTSWQLMCTLLGMLEEAAKEGRGPAFRAVVLPASKASTLSDLAWALSQHPRARFLVLLQAGDSIPAASLPDVAAMLSGYGGFSWPVNATLVAGFTKKVPEELQPLFRNVLKWGASAVN